MLPQVGISSSKSIPRLPFRAENSTFIEVGPGWSVFQNGLVMDIGERNWRSHFWYNATIRHTHLRWSISIAANPSWGRYREWVTSPNRKHELLWQIKRPELSLCLCCTTGCVCECHRTVWDSRFWYNYTFVAWFSMGNQGYSLCAWWSPFRQASTALGWVFASLHSIFTERSQSRHCCFGKFFTFLSVVSQPSSSSSSDCINTNTPSFYNTPPQKSSLYLKSISYPRKSSPNCCFFNLLLKYFKHGSFTLLTIILYDASSKDWARTDGRPLREI